MVTDGAIIGITGSIDRLSRLALMIRASSKTDEVDRVRRWSQNQKPDGFGEVILAMIKHRFSSEIFSMAESLQVQLATSIVYRRNRLLYQTRHESKLRADRNKENISESSPTTLQQDASRRVFESVHEDTTGLLPSQGSQPLQQSGQSAASSAHTYTISQRHRRLVSDAASVYSVDPHIAAQYPEPPQNKICNLCGKVQPLRILMDENHWRYDINIVSNFSTLSSNSSDLISTGT